MTPNKFYDIHYHALDLSHANITAFLSRILEEKKIKLDKLEKNGTVLYFLGYMFKNLPLYIGRVLIKFPCYIYNRIRSIFAERSKGSKVSVNKIRNLLSFMESSIEYDFLIVEYFLKNSNPIVSDNNEFSFNNEKFNKIVLCPLIIDFGYKNIDDKNLFYNIPPQKPITSQIKDLFNAISTYYTKSLTICKSSTPMKKFEVNDIQTDKGERLFEIYPFMGINTKNYEYTKVKEMLDKYFANFRKEDTIEERRNKLYAQMGEFDGDLDNTEKCAGIFAGIKLYPPLGFDPWPKNCTECAKNKAIGKTCECEKAKVRLLYKTCVEKNIPIITHCSTGGFVADKNSLNLSDPQKKWAIVLEEYPELKIDFAHFGSGDQDWRQSIIKYLIRPDSKIYTDFSCSTENDRFYKELGDLLAKSPDRDLLSDKILFGSDFMINLMWMDSYNEYLKYFTDTNHLDSKLKIKFCQTNSEKFLFG